MKRIHFPFRTIIYSLSIVLLFALFGCSQSPPDLAPAHRLMPPEGAYFGVNLDWANLTPVEFNTELGHRAAVFVQFYQFPFTEADFANLDAAFNAVSAEKGMLMITLEPWGGLDTVTEEAVKALVEKLSGYNKKGTAVFIRFAHEMNGSWYPWSQQPTQYIQKFRMVADAVHKNAPETAMLWAPNYGGGYPFSGGQYEAHPEDEDFTLLDTTGDGKVDMTDDPYQPYYPGDEYVDWVGMTIYHWGNVYPWGENELPENDKFIDELTGTYNGLNGDDSTLPDFYAIYFGGHGKPVAIPETAALFNTTREGPAELDIKQAWWRQVLNPQLLVDNPGIKMINWFEWDKPESEINGEVIDWRALGSPSIAEQFRKDLPVDQLVFAPN